WRSGYSAVLVEIGLDRDPAGVVEHDLAVDLAVVKERDQLADRDDRSDLDAELVAKLSQGGLLAATSLLPIDGDDRRADLDVRSRAPQQRDRLADRLPRGDHVVNQDHPHPRRRGG